MGTLYRRLLYVAVTLALVVVVMGAWVRLTDAGLGCPDWPGCYGSLIVPDQQVAAEHEAFPERPLAADKAWHEMIHRYAASTLGLTIVIIALLAWMNRRQPGQPVALPLFLLALVIFQGMLGMWTVTLLLKPLIVMAHLLGGLTTLSVSLWLLLEARRRANERPEPRPHHVSWPALAGLIVLACQISLGGWTSANYAALACPDLPTCNGQWFPDEANFAEGFVMWRGLGIDYEFGVLDAPSRVAIHLTHRIGAVITLLFLAHLGMLYLRRGRSHATRRAGSFALALVITQFLLGLSVVWFGLPLAVATAHNACAALLLLSMVNLNHASSLESPA